MGMYSGDAGGFIGKSTHVESIEISGMNTSKRMVYARRVHGRMCLIALFSNLKSVMPDSTWVLYLQLYLHARLDTPKPL